MKGMKHKKIALIFVGCLIMLIVVGEIGARKWLGLGTPPLTIAHPKIEYMFAPNQDVYRFRNRQLYNEVGMRSIALKYVDQPRRILVFGDSVLNGGNLTDHSDLATTLASDDGAFFGNVSAGSWGPANMEAWIEEFGFQQADTIIVLLSTHDLNDVPTFSPLSSSTHPTSKPVSALAEGIQRYLPRYLPDLWSDSIITNESKKLSISRSGQPRGDVAVAEFINRVSDEKLALCLIQHQTQKELSGESSLDQMELRNIFANRNVPVLDFGKVLRASLERGERPFRDNIHINAVGQQLLADSLHQCAAVARTPLLRLQTQ